MKKLLFISLFLIGSSSLVFAENTDLTAKWSCTTNASHSELVTDKGVEGAIAAQRSAVDAFDFAAKNCGDCTKITCEVQQ